MKNLQEIRPLQNYVLECHFSDGQTKIADLTQFFGSEIFVKLKNPEIFKSVKNHGYFVSWLSDTIDLSADTLWHIGKEIESFDLKIS